MEKFQIAKYGMMQVTAIVYGVLTSGTCLKMWNKLALVDYPKPGIFYGAQFFNAYGLWLLLIVLGWTIFVSYMSSPFSAWEFDSDTLAISGFVVAISLAVLSTFFVLGALAAFCSYSLK